MTKFSATLAAALLMAASPGIGAENQPPAHTDEGDLAEKIVGTWELVSYKVEDKETGALIDAMGSAPRGRVIFTQDGWVAFNLEGTDRRPAETKAALDSLSEAGDEPAIDSLRAEFRSALEEAEAHEEGLAPESLPSDAARRRSVEAARNAVLTLRRQGRIGDDAYFLLEEEFDWAELNATPKAET